MSSSQSPPNFGLIQGQVPWVNRDGTPTTYFFRLIANLFAAAGSGTPPFLAEVSALAIAEGTRAGRDYDRQNADISMLLASLPDPAGRIAALERRIADLEQMLYESQSPTQDLNPMKTQVDNLTAYVMGSH